MTAGIRAPASARSTSPAPVSPSPPAATTSRSPLRRRPREPAPGALLLHLLRRPGRPGRLEPVAGQRAAVKNRQTPIILSVVDALSAVDPATIKLQFVNGTLSTTIGWPATGLRYLGRARCCSTPVAANLLFNEGPSPSPCRAARRASRTPTATRWRPTTCSPSPSSRAAPTPRPLAGRRRGHGRQPGHRPDDPQKREVEPRPGEHPALGGRHDLRPEQPRPHLFGRDAALQPDPDRPALRGGDGRGRPPRRPGPRRQPARERPLPVLVRRRLDRAGGRPRRDPGLERRSDRGLALPPLRRTARRSADPARDQRRRRDGPTWPSTRSPARPPSTPCASRRPPCSRR